MEPNALLMFHIKPVLQSIRLVTNCLLRLTDYGVLAKLGNGVRSKDSRCSRGYGFGARYRIASGSWY